MSETNGTKVLIEATIEAMTPMIKSVVERALKEQLAPIKAEMVTKQDMAELKEEAKKTQEDLSDTWTDIKNIQMEHAQIRTALDNKVDKAEAA